MLFGVKMPDEKIKTWVFGGILVVILALIFLFVQNQGFENLVWIMALLVFFYLVTRYDLIIELKDFERAVVFRFGKMNRVVGPGWTLIIPFVEKFIHVDLRTQTIDVTPQTVITKNGVELKVDMVIYMNVKKDKESVVKSVVEVEDYKEASRLYVIALIRDVVGSLTMHEVISSIEELNVKLTANLDKISDAWGISITAVKIKDVDIPPSVLSAMHDEKAAEQRKLARFEEALAHEKEIEVVKRAAENLSDKAIAYYYVKALEKLGEGSATKFIFPMELSKLANALSGDSKANDSKQLENLFRQYAPAIKQFVEKNRKKKKKK